jgi:hypothetical protein
MTPFWPLHISSPSVYEGGGIYYQSIDVRCPWRISAFIMRRLSDSGTQSSLWMVHVRNFFFNQNFILALPHLVEENISNLLMYDDHGEYQLLKWEKCQTVKNNRAYKWCRIIYIHNFFQPRLYSGTYTFS